MQSDGGKAVPAALSKTHDFYRMLFQVVRNGRVPVNKLELAVSNEHCRTLRKDNGLGPLNNTSKPLEEFPAKFSATVCKGARKYRELKDNHRKLARFVQLSPPEDVAKTMEIMLNLKLPEQPATKARKSVNPFKKKKRHSRSRSRS